MNFIEAVAEMRKGKKVRRSGWKSKGWWFKIKSETFFNQDNMRFSYNLEMVEATDWELMEEKTLYEKRYFKPDNEWGFKESDTKEAINKLITRVKEELLDGNEDGIMIYSFACEEFGEQLLD